MVGEEIIILLFLLIVMGKSASWAIRASRGLARRAGLSEFLIGMVIVTFVSILPETIIMIVSALRGTPALGLGTLLGSNVADLTLIFGLVALASPGDISTDRAFLKARHFSLFFLLLPVILGYTGAYSRLDGLLLLAGGILFFIFIARAKKRNGSPAAQNGNHRSAGAETAILVLALGTMGLAATWAVQYAEILAQSIGMAPALVGLLIVAPGTCLPELIFSLRAVRRRRHTLAIGDILGGVIADASIVLGVVALINPFSFNPRIVIVTGVFMLLAGILFFSAIRSGRKLTRSEGLLLLAFYVVFVIVELALQNWTPIITP